MRSGIWTQRLGLWLTLITSAALVLGIPAAGFAQTAAGMPSRRLPHRPAASGPSILKRELTAASEGSVPEAVANDRTLAADYWELPTSAAAAEQPHAATPEPLMEVVPGEPVETIWEESNFPAMAEQGGACCDGGPVCWPGFSLDHLAVYGGVQASKNNSNRGQDGSFGFHEGINFGTAARNIVLPPSVGLQLGFEAQQANLEGAAFTTDDRKQYFLTAGAFRRSDHGLQGGLVLDYLWDKWNYDDLEAGQLRGEISLALSSQNSIGFWFASSVTENDVVATVFGQEVAETWDTVDYFALFYRTSLFAGGRGEGQLMAGLTEDSDGIIGAKSRMPLINGWALETEFTYLVPDEPRGLGANAHESWNLGMNLVWYPGSLSCGECFRNHRPMFDVANNGSMILRRRP